MDPHIVNLHGSMLDLALRVGRVERELGLQLERIPSATFGQRSSLAPSPDYSTERCTEPCSCEESVMLRERLQELAQTLTNWIAVAEREARRADEAEARARS